MSKIVINGVDGNFGSLVAKYALKLMNKEDLVFTAPKEESLKEIPVSGQLFLLDQKPYQVTEVKNDLGIITLILVANDR